MVHNVGTHSVRQLLHTNMPDELHKLLNIVTLPPCVMRPDRLPSTPVVDEVEDGDGGQRQADQSKHDTVGARPNQLLALWPQRC